MRTSAGSYWKYHAMAQEVKRERSAPARASSGDSCRQEPRSAMSGGARRGVGQFLREKALEVVRAVKQPKRNTQERDGGRESPRPTPEAAPAAEAAVPGPAAAAPVQELSEEAMKKKTLSIVDEYLNIRDVKEAAKCLRELQSPSRHHVFVALMLIHTMEKKVSDRHAAGNLLHFLLRDGVLTDKQFLNGLEQILQFAEDIAIDHPQLWRYLGELVGPTAFDENLYLDEFFQCVLKYVSKRKAAKLFAYMLQSAISDTSQENVAAILNRYSVTVTMFFDTEEEAIEFAKDMVMEFALIRANSSTRKHSARIEKELRTLILKRKASNDDVFDWVNKNISAADTKKSRFIRALVTVVCKGAMDKEEGGVRKCNDERLKDRKSLLQKYIDDNKSLELQALYAVQALFVKLGYPPGFIKSHFDSLYDEEIITEESFYAWRYSPDEEPGKGETVVAASEFFRWLRGAPEKNTENIEFALGQAKSLTRQYSARMQEELRTITFKGKARDDDVFDRDDELDEIEDSVANETTQAQTEVLSDEETENDKEVPPEILARGRLAIEAYNSALSEGRTCVKRLPVMLIGQDRAGKTSLKKSLRGERFNPQEESTIGIDKDPSHFQVTTEIWKAGEKDEKTNSDAATSYEHHAAKLIVSSLMEGKQTSNEEGLEPILSESPPLASGDALDEELPTSPMQYSSLFTSDCASEESPKEKEITVQYVKPRGLSTASVDPSTPRQEVAPPFSKASSTNLRVPGDTTSSLGDEAEVPHNIANLVEKLLQEGIKVEDEDIYSVLWDFGGQLVYYVTHPLFLTPRAIYVLVHDLSRDPCEKANPLEKQGMFKTLKDQFCLKTNLDYLDFWMTSVASLACPSDDHEIHSDPKFEMLPEKIPPVFLVCSHADKPHGGANPCVLANEIFDNLQRKPYSAHLVEHVFVVDNTLSGSECECPEVVRLRQDILAVAQELPQMKEVIPVKWLKYEKALQVTKKDGHKWISLESAKQIAAKVCQIGEDQEFTTLLNFLHDQRIIIHFDDTPELDNFVVLDPQWLINVFSKVITVQPYIRKERKFKELWCKLETTGILEQTLLEHVWAPLLEQQETSESVIAIMQKFSLLCPWPSSEASSVKQYLVPSMLMSHPPQDILDLVASAKLPSLFVKFESGQVPPGLFPRLTLQVFQWGKDEFWSSLNHHFYHNFARFYTSGDQDCSVILLCHPSSIEVVVHKGNRVLELVEGFQSKLNVSADTHHDAFEVACACTVHRQLRLMLESMRKEFCWLENMRYEVGFICPVCCHGSTVNYCRTHHKQDCEHGECLHLLYESELRSASQFIICTRSAAAMNNKVYVKQFAAWFGCPSEQASQQAVDKCDGRLLACYEGTEDKSLALPCKVVESLSWKWCEPKEIVLQLKQSLQVCQASLEQPDPKTKRLIRNLTRKAKHLNRLDVVKHLREITPAGTTGPLLPGDLDIRNVPVRQMRDLTVDLSGREEWKEVAERLGLTPIEIRYLDKRTLNPCEAALASISQRYYINVDDLYDVLNECGLPVVADHL